ASGTISDSITLDTTAPTGGSISINGGNTYTNSTSVTLTLSATGASEMMVSEDSSFSGASYEAYSASKSFTLSSGDGTKTVYVKYRNAAGNETSGTISDSITLDTTAPTGGSISINGGDTYTTSTLATLTLSATGASEMMVSEDSGFSGASYEAYATSKSFTLSSGDGTKTIYVKYRDAAGNETSGSISDSITL
ncbi:MAG TPA: phage tail protein, partial [Desulfotomaculum sp.]|nr:phage tail protein [Desulfotomaculum sp.]